jgi:hypothetical protein
MYGVSLYVRDIGWRLDALGCEPLMMLAIRLIRQVGERLCEGLHVVVA